MTGLRSCNVRINSLAVAVRMVQVSTTSHCGSCQRSHRPANKNSLSGSRAGGPCTIGTRLGWGQRRSPHNESPLALVDEKVGDEGGARRPVPAPAGVIVARQGFELGISFAGGQQGLQLLLALCEGFRRLHQVSFARDRVQASSRAWTFFTSAPRCRVIFSTPLEDGSGVSEVMPCWRR